MAKINPYLTFNGNCDEAFGFYKSVFGTDYLQKSTFAEYAMPGVDNATEGNRIMHVALPIGEGTILMGSDRLSSMGDGSFGDNFSIALEPASEADADKLFNALSAGGNVVMPLGKSPWNAYFGMLVDKYGVQWMVNYTYPQ